MVETVRQPYFLRLQSSSRPTCCSHPTLRKVMEKLNGAIEKLYECERLPEDPLEFIALEVTARGNQQAASSINTQASLKAKLSGSARNLGAQ